MNTTQLIIPPRNPELGLGPESSTSLAIPNGDGAPCEHTYPRVTSVNLASYNCNGGADAVEYKHLMPPGPSSCLEQREQLVDEALRKWADSKEKVFAKAEKKWDTKLKAALAQAEKKILAKRHASFGKLDKKWLDKKSRATDEAIGRWAQRSGILASLEPSIATQRSKYDCIQGSGINQMPQVTHPNGPAGGQDRSNAKQNPICSQTDDHNSSQSTSKIPISIPQQPLSVYTPARTETVPPYSERDTTPKYTDLVARKTKPDAWHTMELDCGPGPYSSANPTKPSPTPKSKHTWTLEETEALMGMRSLGMTYSAIAKEMTLRFERQVLAASVCEKFMRLKRDGDYGEFLAANTRL